jgi:quercetin dioxygenase-like cupin family protein
MTSYFSDAAGGRAGDGRFAHVDALPVADAGNGVTLRALSGAQVMLSHVTIAPHGFAAVHTHDEEQIGLVVSGGCEFDLDGEVRTLGPGDIYHAPPGVPHGARAGEDGCVIVDMFAPPRQALLDLLR